MGASSSQPEWTCKDIPDLTGFRILVTGGDAGIGKVVAENFIQFSNCEKVMPASLLVIIPPCSRAADPRVGSDGIQLYLKCRDAKEFRSL